MIRTRFWKIGTLALLTGVPGCGSDANVGYGDIGNDDIADIPELGISTQGLGAQVADCNNGSNVGGSGNYDTSSKTMTMALTGGANVLSVVGTAVTMNGWSCYDQNGVALTTANVKKMNITTSAVTASKLVFDMLPGSFGTILSATGGVTVKFEHADDEFAVRGNTAANKMKAGEAGGNVYVEVTGDTKADIKLTGGVNIPQVLTFLLGDGADSFDAIDVATVSGSHIDSAATSLNKLSATYSVVVYGGEGDDTIRGGMGDDLLYGNAGADTFLTASESDGRDTFSGGAGIDTVSYVSRTNPIIADINPTGFVAVGKDLFAVGFDGTADFALDVRVDDDSSGVIDASDTTLTITATDAPDPAAALALWNADADAITAGLTFSLDPLNRLVVTGSASFAVVAGQDEAALGVAVGVYDAHFGDADDGEAGEGDDIQEDVENLIGGSHASGDLLVGNDKSNVITGGPGADTISGGLGAAVCTGDVDVLNGGDGNDKFVMGSIGDCGDEIIGGAGTDTVDYQYRTVSLTITLDGTANDGLAAEGDNVKTDVEVIIGGSAADTITGGAGNDTIHGGDGNDVINGGAGNDTLIGNAGNDTLNGGAGDDLFEMNGDDAVFANSATVTTDNKGLGDDLVNGGPGLDKITYAGRSAALTITLCTDNAAATGAAVTAPIPAACTDSDGEAGEADRIINVEWLVGGDGADTLTGHTAAETIEGGAGGDTIRGGAGDDTLFGDDGDDMIYGEDGNDTLYGGAGNDQLDGGNGDADVCEYVAASDTTAAPIACEVVN